MQIILFGLFDTEQDLYKHHPNIQVYSLSLDNSAANKTNSLFSKLNYLKAIRKVKSIISKQRPDIVHAHYATSYGLLGRLSGFHPLLISVWGSDILGFPKKSLVHRWFLRSNLLAADKILATSEVMSDAVFQVTGRRADVTPFGIDPTTFSPGRVVKYFEPGSLVIGVIKSLESHYCIDIAIEAFAKVYKMYPQHKLRLLIVGDGSERNNLKNLVERNNITDAVNFTGKIPYQLVPEHHRMIDIFVNLSENESFGVSVLEASASGKPVVVADAGGLREVVDRDETGFIVPVRNVDSTASAIEKLVLNPELRTKMGEAGRKWVMVKYDWNDCCTKMENIYREFI